LGRHGSTNKRHGNDEMYLDRSKHQTTGEIKSSTKRGEKLRKQPVRNVDAINITDQRTSARDLGTGVQQERDAIIKREDEPTHGLSQ